MYQCLLIFIDIYWYLLVSIHIYVYVLIFIVYQFMIFQMQRCLFHLCLLNVFFQLYFPGLPLARWRWYLGVGSVKIECPGNSKMKTQPTLTVPFSCRKHVVNQHVHMPPGRTQNIFPEETKLFGDILFHELNSKLVSRF